MPDPQPQQPMSEQSGIGGIGTNVDPVAQFRAYMQAQQSAQQMSPSMTHTQQQVEPRERAQGVAGGSDKQRSMQNFGASLQNLVGQVTQKIQQRKATEQQHVFDRFTQSVQGIQQAQQQMQEAQEALKQNPQDPQALQRVQQAQQALKQNQTILDTMFNGPHGEKNAKMLSKGFGIDDKNAQTPERQAAIQATRKSMGVGAGAAGIISQLPQTSQPVAGVQGIKPPTGGQILNSMDKGAAREQQMAIAQLKNAATQRVSDDHLKMMGQLKGIDVSRDDKGNLVTHIMSPEERAKIPYLKAQDDATAAKTEAERATADAKMNPNNPEMRIKMMDAQSRAVDAQARMLSARAAQMRAMASKAKGEQKEPPEVSQARKDLSKFNQDLARTQLAVANKNAGFFGGDKYDEQKAQTALDTIQKNIKSSQATIDKYEKDKADNEPIEVTEEDMK